MASQTYCPNCQQPFSDWIAHILVCTKLVAETNSGTPQLGTCDRHSWQHPYYSIDCRNWTPVPAPTIEAPPDCPWPWAKSFANERTDELGRQIRLAISTAEGKRDLFPPSIIAKLEQRKATYGRKILDRLSAMFWGNAASQGQGAGSIAESVVRALHDHGWMDLKDDRDIFDAVSVCTEIIDRAARSTPQREG